MKSIIQEATSVAKAIEEGWQRAGKPQSFSVKILELEERNFLGMSKKPAKIAFFFEEETSKIKIKTEVKPLEKKIQPAPTQNKSKEKQLNEQTPISTKEKELTLRKTTKKAPWTAQMESSARQWTEDILSMMKLSHIKFSMRTVNNNIKFHFEAPLIKDPKEQKFLFSSFALLLMQTLRNKFKKQFRNLSAVFTTE